jgi:hypothetical protein
VIPGTRSRHVIRPGFELSLVPSELDLDHDGQHGIAIVVVENHHHIRSAVRRVDAARHDPGLGVFRQIYVGHGRQDLRRQLWPPAEELDDSFMLG